jgi:hypothetical protein
MEYIFFAMILLAAVTKEHPVVVGSIFVIVTSVAIMLYLLGFTGKWLLITVGIVEVLFAAIAALGIWTLNNWRM